MLNIFKKIQKLKSCKRKQARRKIVLASLFTGSVTALLTFFTTKKTGEQNRGMIIRKSQVISKNLAKFANETSSKIRSTAEDLAEKTKENAGNLIHEIENKTQDLRIRAENAAHNLANRSEDKVRETVASGANKVTNIADQVENKANKIEEKSQK